MENCSYIRSLISSVITLIQSITNEIVHSYTVSLPCLTGTIGLHNEYKHSFVLCNLFDEAC